MIRAAFSLAILLSSFLLFLVQPMVGRMLLPSLGGTPSVWNTCVVFFQTMLLLGYGYAHFAARAISLRKHVVVHLSLLSVVCFLLPIQFISDWSVPTETNPLGWLLGQLVLCVGIPFFVVSSNAPLLQKWYSQVSGGRGKDPYFLYAISNVGSLGALLAYPLLLEPLLGITAQASLWFAGFLGLAVALLICGWFVIRQAEQNQQTRCDSTGPTVRAYRSLSWRRRLHFAALAAIPSSLMLGVTTFITTDVGSFPLMWVLPLAFFLLTFILVFAERKLIPHRWVVRSLPLLLLLMPVMTLADLGVSPVLMISVHLLCLFLVAMMCHGELARLRPPADQLTEFYLVMSIGGVLGGAFNAFLAPVLFDDVIEYPLMLVAAAAFMPVVCRQSRSVLYELRPRLADAAWCVGFAGIVAVICLGLKGLSIENQILVGIFAFGIPAMLCFSAVGRPVRFALGLAVMIAACSTILLDRETIAKERGFFGVNEVAYDAESDFRWLINGRTMHGLQRGSETESPEPLAYFHRLGPMGDIFRLHRLSDDAQVAVVGLGIGAIASYARPGQHFDFYEIDPVVVQLAKDPRHFNFLSSCKAKHRVTLGDARIQLASVEPPAARHQQTPMQYDLLILDAFSSDSIPTHLVTVEAMELYLERLAPGGLIAMNITNKFVDMRPLVVGFGHRFGLATAMRQDNVRGTHIETNGRSSVAFCVLAREPELIERFLREDRWVPVASPRGATCWTDEHANLFDVLDW